MKRWSKASCGDCINKEQPICTGMDKRGRCPLFFPVSAGQAKHIKPTRKETVARKEV